MRSYIKVLGPPISDAIKELEKVSVEMPHVCIMDDAIIRDIPKSIGRDLGDTFEYNEYVYGYFSRRTGVHVRRERCVNIISDSKEALGDYDFFFEWFESPNKEQLEELIKKIEEALTPLGCLYSITTKT
jgi:hypothetical protein